MITFLISLGTLAALIFLIRSIFNDLDDKHDDGEI